MPNFLKQVGFAGRIDVADYKQIGQVWKRANVESYFSVEKKGLKNCSCRWPAGMHRFQRITGMYLAFKKISSILHESVSYRSMPSKTIISCLKTKIA